MRVMRACSVLLFAVLVTVTFNPVFGHDTTTSESTTKTLQSTTTVADNTNVNTTTSMNKRSTTRRPNTTTTKFTPRTYKSMYEFLFKCSAGSKVIMVGGMSIGLFNTLLALIYCCVLGVISRELTMDDTTTSDTGGPRNSRGIEMGESGLIDSDTSRARLRRDSSLENPTTDLTPQQIRCHKVCKEIIATERSFARNMQTLLDVFYKGLKDQKHLIADSDLVNIFQHVESVLGVSTSLLDHFDEEQAATLKNEGKRMMKLTLTERTVKTYKFIEPYLKMYAAFCNHYEESMETLRNSWTENNKLKKWLDKARHDPRCMGLGVVDLLIQPVQRICKYPLLFGELLKHMEDTDELKQMLEETYTLIKEAAKDVDRRAEDSILQKKMNGLLARLTLKKGVNLDLDDFITPTRKFEFEIKIDILESTVNKNMRQVSNEGVHLLLFSDLLVLGIPKSISDAIKYTKSGIFDLECELLVIFASPLKMLNVRDIDDNKPNELVPERRCVTLMCHRNIGTDTGTDRLIIRFDTVQEKEIFINRENTCRQSVFRAEADLSDRRSNMEKSWTRKKNRYFHKNSNSQTLHDKLDNMAVAYRTRPDSRESSNELLLGRGPSVGRDKVVQMEALADALARAEAQARAEAVVQKAMAAATAAPAGNLGVRNRLNTADFVEQRYMRSMADMNPGGMADINPYAQP